jgi:ABC-type lipoprotein export system ATPase subunit
VLYDRHPPNCEFRSRGDRIGHHPADEPTGNLDSRSGGEIAAVLSQLDEQRGLTVVCVTHDPEIAKHTRLFVHLHDGLVESDEQLH